VSNWYIFLMESEQIRFNVLQILHGEPALSLKEIDKHVQCKTRDIKYHIALLKDDGYVVEESQGHYRITAPGEKEFRRCRISSTIGFDVRGS